MQRSPLASISTQRGVSLVECLVALAVTTVSLGAALPGFDEARQRRDLDGAAAQLETDIQHARSLAVAQDRTLRIDFTNDAAAGCYVVHSGAADTCSCGDDGAAVCSRGGTAMRSVRFVNPGPLQLHSNVRSIVFDPSKGTSTPAGTLRLLTPKGQEVRLVVNIMGRVRSCTPTGVPGHKAC